MDGTKRKNLVLTAIFDHNVLRPLFAFVEDSLLVRRSARSFIRCTSTTILREIFHMRHTRPPQNCPVLILVAPPGLEPGRYC